MNAKKRREDIIIYTLLLAACIALYFWLTPSEVVLRANMFDSHFTPQTFPNLLTLGIAFCSALGLITSLIKYPKLKAQEEKTEQAEKKPKSKLDYMIALAPYITFVLLFGYCLLFEKIGFIISTLIIAPILMFLFGGKKWYQLLFIYAFAALMFVLFKFVLLVPLR